MQCRKALPERPRQGLLSHVLEEGIDQMFIHNPVSVPVSPPGCHPAPAAPATIGGSVPGKYVLAELACRLKVVSWTLRKVLG